MSLGCNFLRQSLFSLVPNFKFICHLNRFSSSAHAYQVRGDKKLHCEELLKERKHIHCSPNTERKMSAGEESPVTKDEGASVKRPQFGNRYLDNPDNVFQHNAWDNVAWDPEQLEAAKKKVDDNSREQVEPDKRELYEAEADRYWNEFYSQHQNKFFKDRHWLFTEFPELSSDDPQISGKKSSCEGRVSRGTTGRESTHRDGASPGTPVSGSSMMDNHPKGGSKTSAEVHSAEAHSIEMLSKEEVNHEDCEHSSASLRTSLDESGTSESSEANFVDFPGKSACKRILEVGCGVGNTIFPILQTNADPTLFVYGCDFSSVAVDIVCKHAEYNPSRCHAFVCDVSDPAATFPFPNNSLDLVVLIFVLSAINPDRFLSTIQTLSRLLKPGGRILFRDYGRYDMAQLRFKKGRCLSENFYVRGDGTRVYFFTQDELQALFTSAGLIEEQNIIDRRLQVNRGRQLTMYRVWIQCKYRKP